MFAQPLRALEFSTPRSPQRHCVLCIISPMSSLRHCISYVCQIKTNHSHWWHFSRVHFDCVTASTASDSTCIISRVVTLHHKGCCTCLQEMLGCSPRLLSTSLAVSIILIKSTDAGSFTCFRILQALLHGPAFTLSPTGTRLKPLTWYQKEL